MQKKSLDLNQEMIMIFGLFNLLMQNLENKFNKPSFQKWFQENINLFILQIKL